jgi:hypothetical protein
MTKEEAVAHKIAQTLVEEGYTHHYAKTVRLDAQAEEVFCYLDDPLRLTAHMSQSSWMMAGSKMETELDSKKGQAQGSRIILRGSFLGVPIYVSEIIVERLPSRSKRWRTEGAQKLIIMDQYQMGFELKPQEGAVNLTIFIDYTIPCHGVGRTLGKLASHSYAKWCVDSMIRDVRNYFKMQNGNDERQCHA